MDDKEKTALYTKKQKMLFANGWSRKCLKSRNYCAI